MFLSALILTAGLIVGQMPAEPQQARPTSEAPAEQKPDSPSDQKAEAKEPPTPPHTGIRALFRNLGEDYKHLPSRNNAYLALLGGGLVALSHPGDNSVNARLRSHYSTVNNMYKPAQYLGDTPVQMALSMGTYAYGRVFHAPKASHLGMDLLRAQILTESIVQPLKFAISRERPDLSNHLSFPSGHAAITFAAATVIERHLGWRRSLLGYAVASYVASSRLHDNRHFLSDVVFGAAIGTIAGRTIAQHGHDYWVLTPVNVPGGVAILASRAR